MQRSNITRSNFEFQITLVHIESYTWFIVHFLALMIEISLWWFIIFKGETLKELWKNQRVVERLNERSTVVKTFVYVIVCVSMLGYVFFEFLFGSRKAIVYSDVTSFLSFISVYPQVILIRTLCLSVYLSVHEKQIELKELVENKQIVRW